VPPIKSWHHKKHWYHDGRIAACDTSAISVMKLCPALFLRERVRVLRERQPDNHVTDCAVAPNIKTAAKLPDEVFAVQGAVAIVF